MTATTRDWRRTVQVALGMLWLVDGALQFQPFMYSHGFTSMLTATTAGQPDWVARSVTWAAHLAQGNLAFYNTLFALAQVAIGAGLMQRSTVRPALLASFAWTLIVWWFGESFGLLFTAQANPLSGAPGAVVLYAIVGAIAWPGSGRFTGERLARAAWCGLWLLMAWLWLGPAASGADAVSATIRDAPSGFGLLHAVQSGTASAAAGHGLAIAIVLAAASVTIGVGGAYGREPGRFLALGAGLNVGFWLLGQGLGGIFEGGATDPNTGPLFVLMAFAVYSATHAPGVPAALDASGRASATPVARTAVTAPPRAAPAA